MCPVSEAHPQAKTFAAGELGFFHAMVVQNDVVIEDAEAFALAAARPTRSPQPPDVRTFQEQGCDGMIETPVGLVPSGGIGPDMRAKIHETVHRICRSGRADQAHRPWDTHGPESFDAYQARVTDLIGAWVPGIEAAGISE